MIKRSSVQEHLLIKKSNFYLQELHWLSTFFWSKDPLFKNMFDKQIKVLSTCFNQSKCYGQSTRLKYIWWSSNPVFNYNCWLTNKCLNTWFDHYIHCLIACFDRAIQCPIIVWSTNQIFDYMFHQTIRYLSTCVDQECSASEKSWSIKHLYKYMFDKHIQRLSTRFDQTIKCFSTYSINKSSS